MDSLKRFAPEQELAKSNIPRFYRWRTLIIFCIFLLLTVLWAVCCRSCVAELTGRVGFGGGGADFGTGPGSGNAGDGPGAGKTGDNKGKHDQAKGSAGIGKDASTAGTDNPADGKFAVDGTPSTPAAPGLTQPPVHIESIAQEVIPQVPVKVVAKKFTGGAPQGRKGFYGMKVRKTSRVLFIVDCSDSMGAGSSEIPGKSRMDVLKMELEKAIFASNISRSSPGGFSIVKFSNGAEYFPPPQKGMCKYSDTKRMKEAKEFIDQLYPSGGTNMKSAWRAALEVIKKQSIDTVYFLTDGDPGDGFDPVWLQKTIKKGNIRGRLTVNCIAIGGGRELMKKIAEDFQGSFVVIP